MNISVVINTRNESENIKAAIDSVSSFASEIVVVDMESTDQTQQIAKDAGAQVFSHPHVGYVEPARNFAIQKSQGPWILILDADERIPETLANELQRISQQTDINFAKIPRKNIIFNQWIQHSGWWPDYNVRFFQKGSVTWQEEIHSQPQTSGNGYNLAEDPQYAIEHHHYQSISQYITRLNRYTDHQLTQLTSRKYQFAWSDLITKPTAEFLNRYFANSGYKDGVHGLALALLQSFSELVLYLKAWEAQKFIPQSIEPVDIEQTLTKACKDLLWWIAHLKEQSGTKLHSKITRLKSKLL